MKLERPHRLDDTFNFLALAGAAVFAIGLALSGSMNYALDRGAAQAKVGDLERATRVANASSPAAPAAREIRLATSRP